MILPDIISLTQIFWSKTSASQKKNLIFQGSWVMRRVMIIFRDFLSKKASFSALFGLVDPCISSPRSGEVWDRNAELQPLQVTWSLVNLGFFVPKIPERNRPFDWASWGFKCNLLKVEPLARDLSFAKLPWETNTWYWWKESLNKD